MRTRECAQQLATEHHLSLSQDSAAAVTFDVIELRYGININEHTVANSSPAWYHRVEPNVSYKVAISW
jgi:hypothetical protein